MSTSIQALCPLLLAIKKKDFETADRLLSDGVSCQSLINYRSDPNNSTLLHEAILNDDMTTLRYLTTIPELIINLYTVQDAKGCTPKFLAASLGKITLLKNIFRTPEKELIDYRNELTKEPLWVYTARTGTLANFEALLSLATLKNQLIQSRHLLLSTMIATIKNLNVEKLKLISGTCQLFNKESVEIRNFIAEYRCPDTGGTILSCAVKYKSVDCLEFLLSMCELAMLLESPDSEGMSPLVAAVAQGSKAMAELLVLKGAITTKLRTYLYSDKFSLLYYGRAEYRISLLDKAISDNKPEVIALLFSFMNRDELRFLMNFEALSPIVKVVQTNNVNLLKFLMDQHPDPTTLTEIQDTFGLNLLMIAARESNKEMVNCLLEIPTVKSAINIKNRAQESALNLACKKSKFDIARLLLKHGASQQEFMEYRSEDNSSVLIEAIWKGDFDSIQFILSLKASDQLITAPNKNKQTPLMLALRSGSTKLIKQLMARGAKVDFKDTSLLDILFQWNAEEIFEMLFEYHEFKALLLQQNSKGEIPILSAVLATSGNQTAKITQIIIEKSIDGWTKLLPLALYKSPMGDSLLFHLIEFDQKEKLEYLLKLPPIRVLMAFRNYKGQSPLYFAAIQAMNRTEIVKILIEIGDADYQELISWRDLETGNNILFHRGPGDDELIQYLLEIDAFKTLINIPNKMGQTPLIAALLIGKLTTVTRLLEKGASVETLALFKNPIKESVLYKLITGLRTDIEKINFILDLFQKSTEKNVFCNALMIACLQKNKYSFWIDSSFLNNLIALLMKHGATFKECIDVRLENGDTILSTLTRQNDYIACKYLVDAGIASALLKIPNNAGETPLSIAIKSKQTKLIPLLLECILPEDLEYYHYAMEETTKFRSSNNETILSASLRERNLSHFRYFMSHKALKSLLFEKNQQNRAAIRELLSEFYENNVEIIDYGINIQEIAEFRDLEGRHIFEHYLNRNFDDHHSHDTKKLYHLLQWQPIRNLIHVPNKEGLTLVIAAALYGRFNVYNLLRNYGAMESEFKAFRHQGETLLGYYVQFHASLNYLYCLDKLLKLPVFKDMIEDINSDGKTPLISAALNGELPYMKLLMDHGANVDSLINYRDKFANTILHLAVKLGLKPVLRFVLNIPQIKSQLETANINNETPLLIAVLEGERKCFKILLQSGASTKILQEYQTQSDDTLLAQLSGCKDTESGRDNYLATNLSYEFLMLPFIAAQISTPGEDGYIPLLKTVLSGHLINLKCLLKAGATITSILNYSDKDKNNIFHKLANCIIEESHEKFLIYLISNYPELKEMLHAKNINDATPFVSALNLNNEKCLRAFYHTGAYTLEHLTAIKYTNGDNILLKAVDLGNEAIVKFFLEIEGLHDALIEELNNKGYSAWILSILKGDGEIIRLIDVDEISTEWKNGYLTLAEAASNGFLNGVKYLLQIPELKLTIKRKDLRGRTALFRAAARGHAEIVELLLENGSESLLELSSRVNDMTVLHEAAYIGSVQGIQYLLNLAGFKRLLDSNDKNQNTPIMFASYENNNHLEAFKELLKWGANISLVDSEGCTALDNVGESLKPIVAKIKSLMELSSEQSEDVLGIQLHQTLTSALKLGISFNMRFENRNTLLHLAAIHGNAPLLRELVSLGADLHAQNEVSQNALEVAREVPELATKVLSFCTLLMLHAESDYQKLFEGIKDAIPITIPDSILKSIRECIDFCLQIENKEELGYISMRLAKWIWNEAPLRDIFKIEQVVGLYRRIPINTHYYHEAQFEIATLMIGVGNQISLSTLKSLQTKLDVVEEPESDLDQQKAKIYREIAYLHAFESGSSENASVLRKEIQGALEGKGFRVNSVDLLDPVQLFKYLQEHQKELTPLLTEKKIWQEKLAATQKRLQHLKQEARKRKVMDSEAETEAEAEVSEPLRQKLRIGVGTLDLAKTLILAERQDRQEDSEKPVTAETLAKAEVLGIVEAQSKTEIRVNAETKARGVKRSAAVAELIKQKEPEVDKDGKDDKNEQDDKDENEETASQIRRRKFC